MQIVIDLPDLWNPTEAAKLIGVSHMTVYRWLKQGKIEQIEVDHCSLIPRSEILRLQIKRCSNCYHYQEFGHCSCRAAEDVETRPNMCHDWRPLDILTKRS